MARKRERLFGGAGIIVRRPSDDPTGGSITVVETEHAAELSELVFALRDVFAGSIDYLSKYEFYGRLADAANRQLSHGDEFESVRDAVIREACAIASEMGDHLYFAYGSNMDGGQMARRCPKSIFAGTATLKDHEFELDSSGAATVVARPGSVVHGALWLIAESDERAMDRYEGVASGCYRKEVMPVEGDACGSVFALAYVSNRDMHDGVTYRTGYMDAIIESARRLGFDAKYVEHLEEK